MNQKHDAPEGGAEWKMVPVEPTPEMLEPFARALCEARRIDPDEPCAPHGEFPTWFGQCGPVAEAWPLALAAATTPPAPSVLVDATHFPLKASVWFRDSTNEWVLEIEGSINETGFTSRHTEPATTRPEDVPGLPSLYAAVPEDATLAGQQGGAVPAGDLPSVGEIERLIDAYGEKMAQTLWTSASAAKQKLLSTIRATALDVAAISAMAKGCALTCESGGDRLPRVVVAFPSLPEAQRANEALAHALRSRLAEQPVPADPIAEMVRLSQELGEDQPAPAGTGADGVEGLRKAAENVLAIWDDTSDVPWMVNVDKRMEALRAALDAGSSEERR